MPDRDHIIDDKLTLRSELHNMGERAREVTHEERAALVEQLRNRAEGCLEMPAHFDVAEAAIAALACAADRGNEAVHALLHLLVVGGHCKVGKSAKAALDTWCEQARDERMERLAVMLHDYAEDAS